MMKAVAALLSVLQGLLSVEKLPSLPILDVFLSISKFKPDANKLKRRTSK